MIENRLHLRAGHDLPGGCVPDPHGQRAEGDGHVAELGNLRCHELERIDVTRRIDGALALRRYRQSAARRIGNLTLITGSFNGSLSDSAPDVKHPALVEQSKLQLNARIGATEVWDESAVTARAKELSDIVTDIRRSPTEFARP